VPKAMSKSGRRSRREGGGLDEVVEDSAVATKNLREGKTVSERGET